MVLSEVCSNLFVAVSPGSGLVITVRFLSVREIDLFENYLHSIGMLETI